MEDSQEARTWWKQWIWVEKLIFPVSVTQKEQLSGVFISDFEKSAFMRHPNGRVVLQGPNPFLDNHYGTTNPKLGDYSPYSQIYNVRRNSKEGISYVFLR